MAATDLFFAATGFIVLALEGVAALLILGGGAAAIGVLVVGRDPARARHAMSHMLLLALDFTIGADILRAVATPPDLVSVEVLAIVVLIRILLTFTLQHELRPSAVG